MSESSRYESEARLTEETLRAQLQAGLGADFDVRDRLARGRWSTIYRAGQRILDRWLAVKVLHAAGPVRPLAQRRFLRGAQLLSHLDHRHILPIWELMEQGSVCCQLLPLMHESLAAVLLREGRLPGAATARILLEVAQALDVVHGMGVVHCDIKPQHILLDGAERRVRLTDFSSAAFAWPAGNTRSKRREVVGSPAYISPEQAECRPQLDGRSDLYMLGAVGYQMLTGSPPFPGPAQRQLEAHRTQEPEHVADRARDAPARLAVIVMRCLAKRPEDRWQSAGELAKVLASCDYTGHSRIL
ncbi:MAG TPA: serine/threonine-protein kinase [Gemmatimonadales bacterium]